MSTAEAVAWNLFLYACACGGMQWHEIYFCVHASAAKCDKMQIIYVYMRTRRKRQYFDECVFYWVQQPDLYQQRPTCAEYSGNFAIFHKFFCNEIQMQNTMNVKIYDNGKKVGMKSAGLWMIVHLFAVFPKMLTYLPDNTTCVILSISIITASC